MKPPLLRGGCFLSPNPYLPPARCKGFAPKNPGWCEDFVNLAILDLWEKKC